MRILNLKEFDYFRILNNLAVVTDKGFEEAKKIAKERAENFVKRITLKDLILVFIKDMNGKTCSA